MMRIAKMKLVAAVVAVVLTAGGGIVAVNQLMAQSSAPKSTAAITSNEPTGAATPKAALHALAAAGRAADVEGMKALVDIRNPPEEQLLQAACEYAGSRKAFLEAVNAKFGEPAMTRLDRGTMQFNMFDVFLKDIETKTDTLMEQIHGDEAILSMGGEVGDVRLLRDDSGWRLSAAGTMKDWAQAKYTEVLTGVQQGNVALGDLMAGINEGRFATFADLAKTVHGMRRGQ